MHIQITNGQGQISIFQAQSFSTSPTFDGESTEEGPYGPMWTPGSMSIDVEIVLNEYPQCISDLINDAFTTRINTNISLTLMHETIALESAHDCVLTNVSYTQSNDYEIKTYLTFVSFDTSLNSQPKVKKRPVKPSKIDWRKEGF